MAAIGGSSGSQTAGGIRAGLAYVELVARDKIGPVLDKLQKRFAGLGTALTKGGAASAAAGGALLAPVVAMLTAGADRFGKMANDAKLLDLPIDRFYRLSTAAEIAGVSIEQLAEDPGKYADVIAEVGEAPVEAIQAAVEAGRDWRRTLIALKDAAAGLLTGLVPLLKTVTGIARENPGLVKAVAVGGTAMVALGAASVTVGAGMSGLALGVGAVKAVMIGAAVSVKAVVGAMFALKAVLGATVTLMPVLTFALAALKAVLFGGLAGLVGLKAAFLAIMSPVGIAAAAIVALGYAIGTQTAAGEHMATAFKAAFGSLGPLLTDLGETFKRVWDGVLAALQNGDLEAAFRVVTAGLKVAWFTLLDDLTRRWVEFKRGLEASQASAVDAIGETIMAAEVGWIRILFGHEAAQKRAEEMWSNWSEMARHEARTRAETGNPQLAAARAELDAARRGLQEALNRAAAPRAAAAPRTSSEPGMPVTSAMMASARGAFSGPLGQQLGAGSQFQKDLLRGINRDADATEAAKKVLEGIAGDLAKVLAFQ